MGDDSAGVAEGCLTRKHCERAVADPWEERRWPDDRRADAGTKHGPLMSGSVNECESEGRPAIAQANPEARGRHGPPQKHEVEGMADRTDYAEYWSVYPKRG